MQSSSLLTQRAVDPILAIARHNLEADGRLLPVLFVRFRDGRQSLLPLELSANPNAKRRHLEALGHALNRNGVAEALFLGEGWCVDARTAPDALKVRPSRHPCRQEAIALVGRNRPNTRHTCVLQPFGRDSQNKPVWQSPLRAVYDQEVTRDTQASGLLDWFFASADVLDLPA